MPVRGASLSADDERSPEYMDEESILESYWFTSSYGGLQESCTIPHDRTASFVCGDTNQWLAELLPRAQSLHSRVEPLQRNSYCPTPRSLVQERASCPPGCRTRLEDTILGGGFYESCRLASMLACRRRVTWDFPGRAAPAVFDATEPKARPRRDRSQISLAGFPAHRAPGGTYSPFMRKESAASTAPSPIVTP